MANNPAGSISSGQGLGITRPGRQEGDPVKKAVGAARSLKAGKVKAIKIKFGKGAK